MIVAAVVQNVLLELVKDAQIMHVGEDHLTVLQVQFAKVWILAGIFFMENALVSWIVNTQFKGREGFI